MAGLAGQPEVRTGQREERVVIYRIDPPDTLPMALLAGQAQSQCRVIRLVRGGEVRLMARFAVSGRAGEGLRVAALAVEHGVDAVQREEPVVIDLGRPLPRLAAMATLAVRRQAEGHMVRISGCLVVGLMTDEALTRGANEHLGVTVHTIEG